MDRARVDSFLRALHRDENPVNVLERVAAQRGAAVGGDDPSNVYAPDAYEVRMIRDPESTMHEFTGLYTIAPLPRSLFGDLAQLYVLGGIGFGSCFYDSIAFALNIDNYVDAFVQHDLERMKEIGGRFRCSFMKNMNEERWRAFLHAELKRTPHSASWREVVSERVDDTHNDLHDDFCRYDRWATEATARYVARELSLTIYIIDKTTMSFFCGVHNDDVDAPVVLIAWENHCHFSPVVFVDGCAAGRVSLYSVITDDAMKRAVRDVYRATCRCNQFGSPCFVDKNHASS